MSDFDQFQREQEAERQREQRRATGDIDDDNAWERKHQRVRKVRNVFGRREKQRGLTPVHGFAAGTWAQVMLAAVWFVVVGALTGALQMPVRGVTVGTLVGAAVLAKLSWHALGPRGRDVLRAGVRVVGVLLLLGVVGGLVWLRLT